MLEEGQEENFKCCWIFLAVYWQEWTWGPHGLPTRECEAHDGKYLSPVSGYVQTCLTAGGWTRPVTDSKLLMLSARFFVKGPVTQSCWCQPRSVPVKDLVHVPEFCLYWAEQSLLLSSWPILFQLLWNPYPWKQFFHWLHGLSLFLTTRNVKTVLFLNKIEYSHAWAGVGIS